MSCDKRVLIILEENFLQILSLKYIQLLFFHKCNFFSVDRCSAAFIERAIYDDCAASYYYMMSSMEDTQRCRSIFRYIEDIQMFLLNMSFISRMNKRHI